MHKIRNFFLWPCLFAIFNSTPIHSQVPSSPFHIIEDYFPEEKRTDKRGTNPSSAKFNNLFQGLTLLEDYLEMDENNSKLCPIQTNDTTWPPQKSPDLLQLLRHIQSTELPFPGWNHLEARDLTSIEREIITLIRKVFNFDRSNPLFGGPSNKSGSYFLPILGRAISYKEAALDLFSTLKSYPGLTHTANGAILFHGAPSASLLAFSQYSGTDKGKLIPTGQLIKKGKVPFGGEIIFGLSGVNKENLSTVFFSYLDKAISYAGIETHLWRTDKTSEWEFANLGKGWNLEEGESGLRELSLKDGPLNFMEKNLQSVTIKRIQQWMELNQTEKRLVQDNFPVIYGLHPNRTSAYENRPRGSQIQGEVLVKDGVQLDEIKVIYVPSDRLQEVRELFQKNIGSAAPPISALEDLHHFPSHLLSF